MLAFEEGEAEKSLASDRDVNGIWGIPIQQIVPQLDRLPIEAFSHIVSFLSWKERLGLRLNKSLFRAVSSSDFYATGKRAVEISKNAISCHVLLGDGWVFINGPSQMDKVIDQCMLNFRKIYVEEVTIIINDFDEKTEAAILRLLKRTVFERLVYRFLPGAYNPGIFPFMNGIKQKITMSLHHDALVKMDDFFLLQRPVAIYCDGIGRVEERWLVEFVRRGHDIVRMPVYVTSPYTILAIYQLIADCPEGQSVSLQIPYTIYYYFLALMGIAYTGNGIRELILIDNDEVKVIAGEDVASRGCAEMLIYRGTGLIRHLVNPNISSINISKDNLKLWVVEEADEEDSEICHYDSEEDNNDLDDYISGDEQHDVHGWSSASNYS